MQPYILVTSIETTFHYRLNSILTNENFNIIHTQTIQESIEAISNNKVSIVLLDGSLLDEKEIKNCQLLREKFSQLIVILSNNNYDIFDEAEILNYGADSILNKEQSNAVLIANIQALLRRNYSGKQPPSEKNNYILTIQDLIINYSTYQLIQRKKEVKLTNGEMQLLIILAQQVGKIVNRDELFKKLIGVYYNGQSRSLDLRISSLRQKLGDTKAPYQYIKTIRGKGYLLVP